MSDKHDDPRAHALRERYHAAFGGEELPVPVKEAVHAAAGNNCGVSDEALAWRCYNLGLQQTRPA